jgi:hypothetical protein
MVHQVKRVEGLACAKGLWQKELCDDKEVSGSGWGDSLGSGAEFCCHTRGTMIAGLETLLIHYLM